MHRTAEARRDRVDDALQECGDARLVCHHAVDVAHALAVGDAVEHIVGAAVAKAQEMRGAQHDLQLDAVCERHVRHLAHRTSAAGPQAVEAAATRPFQLLTLE